MSRMLIAPSILAADFARLGEQLKTICDAGADWIHYDVMDGVFVPEISYGEPVLRCIKKVSDMPVDAHLMIVDPIDHIESFVKAGADRITIHLEASGDTTADTLDKIREAGASPALSVKPQTPVEEVFPYLEKCDMILVMTVVPGFGGQAFMPESLERIAALRKEIVKRGLDVDIQVDGGIDMRTISLVKEAGANVFVAGSAVFKGDIPENVRNLRSLIEG